MIALSWNDDTRHLVASGGRIAAIVIVALLANRLLTRGVHRVVTRMQARAAESQPGSIGLDDRARRVEARTGTVSTMLRSLSATIIYGLAALLVLGEAKINLGPLVAGAGIAGIAIGFGAQSLVRDVLAGIFVLIEDQYGVGDVIDAGPATGTVERVTLRSTQLRDLAGTVWHIPNGSITRVGNKSQSWARAVVEVVIAHDADIVLARGIVRRVATELVADPEWGAGHLVGETDEQGISALTPEGVTLRLVVDTEPKSQWKVERELRQRLIAAFGAEGVPLQVHHPSGPAT